MLIKYIKIKQSRTLVCPISKLGENKCICIRNGLIAQKYKYKYIRDVGIFWNSPFML